MRSNGRFGSWFRFWLHRSRIEREMDLELRLHIENHAEDLARTGLPADEALRRARVEFGAIEAHKDDCREALGLRVIDEIKSDFRYTVRQLLQSPGVATTAVAALALGIGMNAAIFSVVDAVILRPVPFPDPDRLVVLMNVSPAGSNGAASPARFQHWQSQSGVLDDVTAYRSGIENYTEGDTVEQLASAHVSSNYFRCFGMPVLRGRAFTVAEDRPDGPRVAVIGYDFWQREFGRDPRVIGQPITLGGDSYKVIGVLAENPYIHRIGPDFDVFLPFPLDPNTGDLGNYFQVAARLKPGVSLAQAQDRLRLSSVEYRARFPRDLAPDAAFTVLPMRDAMIENVRSSLFVLSGAVSLVLMIACANVANLLLARATNRKREIGIRIAIGAGRGRIVRQLLTESVLLSLTGGALGLLLGFTGIRALLAVSTAGLPRVGQGGSALALDGRVLAFTILVSLVTGVLFGLIPAMGGSRGIGTNTGLRRTTIRSLLVLSEVSLAVILLMGSALLIRSVAKLNDVDAGFDQKNILVAKMSLTGPAYQRSAEVETTVRDALQRVRSLPGVVAASATCCVPLQGGFALPFNIIGQPAKNRTMGAWTAVSPGFFEVYRIPVKRGRAFDQDDTSTSQPVAVISESLAKRYWTDGDPFRDRIVIGKGLMKEREDEPERQIIGIVGDIRAGGLSNPPLPTIYVPEGQVPDAANAMNQRVMPMSWVIRVQGPSESLDAAIRDRLRQASGLPVFGIKSMSEIVSESTSRQRFNMLLMTIFGGCALVLAAIGIYGLMAHSVQEQTQEIGIRLSLGAGSDRVRSAVVLQGMRLAILGVCIGTMAAFGLSRFIAGFLFGVQPRDPLVFVTVPIVLALVALVAVWFPANRASRIDPVEALRHE